MSRTISGVSDSSDTSDKDPVLVPQSVPKKPRLGKIVINKNQRVL